MTVATHATNGTELANETITVTPVSAPTVEFHDQVQELDTHDEVHTLTVDTVAANQQYYVDVHTPDDDLNKTRTFSSGTARTELELVLDPTITSTQNVTVAVHATDGTELAAETATITTVELDVSNQTREVDKHDEVHTISVDAVGAGTDYYVDVHGTNGDLSETTTFNAGTRRTDLALDLSPTLTTDRTVTAAIHAADGTELAAEQITVDVADQTTATPTETTTATPTATETESVTESDSPGFGVVAALVALVGTLLIARKT